MIEQLLPLFSSRLVRNRATLGGNLATASPIGDALPVLLALDAHVTLLRAGGERRMPVAAFLRGYRETALQPGEVIARVHLPRPFARWQRFYKVSKRRLDDISTVSAAFALELDDRQCVEKLRIAYGGIASSAVRATAAEKLATGQRWSRETIDAVQRELEQVGSPIDDHRGSAAYRRAMVRALFEKLYDETTAQIRETT